VGYGTQLPTQHATAINRACTRLLGGCRGISLVSEHPPQDPAVGRRLGPYGGPRGWAFFLNEAPLCVVQARIAQARYLRPKNTSSHDKTLFTHLPAGGLYEPQIRTMCVVLVAVAAVVSTGAAPPPASTPGGRV